MKPDRSCQFEICFQSRVTERTKRTKKRQYGFKKGEGRLVTTFPCGPEKRIVFLANVYADEFSVVNIVLLVFQNFGNEPKCGDNRFKLCIASEKHFHDLRSKLVL